MTLVGLTRKTALVAVFLFVCAACSSGDGFQADPDATVLPEQLPVLVAAAGDALDLEPLRDGPVQRHEDDRESCWGREVWTDCSLDGGPDRPGWQASFENEDGTWLTVVVFIGVDAVEAQDTLSGQAQHLQMQSNGLLRALLKPAELGDSFVLGPCDKDGVRASEAGCAWWSRTTPGVGDDAMAFGSDTVGDLELSALLLARGPVFVEIQAWGYGTDPGREAERLGRALDEQIKALLSP